MLKYKYFKLALLLSILNIFSIPSLNAKIVSVGKAKEIASTFWNNNSLTKSSALDLVYSWDSHSIFSLTRSSNDSPTFYVFTNPESGFVIVSGEDRTIPILGYSFNSKISNNSDLPVNFIAWLKSIHEQICYIRDNDLPIHIDNNSWEDFEKGKDVIRYITAEWGQHEPENLQCPYDGSERSVAGCLPIAYAIKMRYHQWPSKGNGITEPYSNVPSRNLEHTYDWNNMIMEYYNSSYSEQEADAVATLVADIGAALQAEYSSESTSADFALQKISYHFNYSSNIRRVYNNSFDQYEWMSLIKKELFENGPVLYSGSDRLSGHAFIIDGLTDTDYFHINWGWSGYCNGYYILNSLNPGSYRFDYYNSCILNFKPASSTLIEDTDYLCYYSDRFNKGGLVSSTNNINVSSDFKIEARNVLNGSINPFDGFLKIALVDKKDVIKEWISDSVEVVLDANQYYNYIEFNCRITSHINFEDRIRCYYKDKDSYNWKLLKHGVQGSLSTNLDDLLPWEILISGEKTIEETTSLSYNQDQSITVRFKPGVNVSLFYNGEDITDELSINGEENSLTIPKDLLKEGKYLLSLRKGIENKDLTFVIKYK